MGKRTSTVDLGGVDGEIAAARQRAHEAKAHAVHAELTALVQRENHDSYRKCQLLGQVRDEALHRAYAEGFGPYCVRYRFATSERLACAMATLWTKLKELPELRAVFKSGQVGWTLVRDAADMATAKLATDAELAKVVATGTHGDLRALKRRALIARGETPTTTRLLEWTEETDARLARVLAILSAEAEPVLGRTLTLGEGIEHMLVLVEQVQIGHDPDRMLYLCTTHHLLRHQGWLRISGRRSTGFHFLRADGTELTASVGLPAVVGSVAVPVVAVDAAAPAAAQTSRHAHVGASARILPPIAPAPTAAPGAHVGARSASNQQAIADVERALVGLECTKSEAHAYVARAMTTLDSDFTAEALLFAALRAMPG